jgi:hypothetical protein
MAETRLEAVEALKEHGKVKAEKPKVAPKPAPKK